MSYGQKEPVVYNLQLFLCIDDISLTASYTISELRPHFLMPHTHLFLLIAFYHIHILYCTHRFLP